MSYPPHFTFTLHAALFLCKAPSKKKKNCALKAPPRWSMSVTMEWRSQVCLFVWCQWKMSQRWIGEKKTKGRIPVTSDCGRVNALKLQRDGGGDSDWWKKIFLFFNSNRTDTCSQSVEWGLGRWLMELKTNKDSSNFPSVRFQFLSIFPPYCPTCCPQPLF